MSKRRNYPCNGKIRIENVRERIRNNDFPRIPIGTIGGIDGWYIQMNVSNVDNVSLIGPLIYCPNKPTLALRTCFNKVNNKGLSFSIKEYCLNPEEALYGFRMDATELLDERNKYLDKYGRLSIKYGIQVKSIKMNDGIWKFNFYDTVFNSQSMGNMISFISEKFLHCPKQLLKFHSKYFNSKSNHNRKLKIPSNIDYEALEKCLQIAHGVRLQLSSKFEIYKILKAARRYSLSNVTYYCEQMLIEQDFLSINDAIALGSNHCLALLMNQLDSSKKLKAVLEDVFGGTDIQRSDGTWASIFFENYKMESENSEVPQRWIEEYERSVKNRMVIIIVGEVNLLVF